MRNLAGRLNRKIELWENVKTESVNAIGQTKWENARSGTYGPKLGHRPAAC